MKLNNIKKSFDERVIAPSSDSWDKLAQRLDNEQKTKKRPYLYWLGAVAAAIVIALMIIVPVFTNSTDSINDSVVKQDTIPVIENNSSIAKKDTDVENKVVNTTAIQNQESTIATKPTKTLTAKESQQTVQQQNNSQLAQNEVNKQGEMTKNSVQVYTNTAVVVQEQKEIIVGSAATTKLTAAQEADLLLERAMATLKTQPTGVASKSIDPKKLLMETQWDIDAEKRNRLENMLLDQFGKLKAQVVTLVDKK